MLFSALIEEDFYLIHRADAADAPAAGEVCLEQALARPLVFPSQAHGHCTRTLVEHAVKQHGLAVGEIVMEVNSVHILKSAVEAGIGHTIMPLNLAVREIEDGRLVAHRIAADGLSRTLGICSCASMPASHLKTLISELIREVVRAMCAGGDWPGASGRGPVPSWRVLPGCPPPPPATRSWAMTVTPLPPSILVDLARRIEGWVS